MHPIIIRKLSEIIEARRAVRLRWVNAILLVLAAAALGVAIFVPGSNQHYTSIVLGVAGFLFVGGLLVRWLVRPERFDAQQLARDVEAKNPELRSLLITAVEQKPGATGLSYLQERVINSAVKEAVKHLWSDELTAADQKRSAIAVVAGVVCLVLTCGSFVYQLLNPPGKPQIVVAKPQPKKPEQPKAHQFEIEVTPGDTEVEKGARLVVEAKFATDVPEEAALVICNAKGEEQARQPMKLTVDGKVFGGMMGNIKADGEYRVEFEKQKSRDFKITTFVHPELVSADATVTPPAYTGQPSREIKNTFKVTMMEGSKLAYRMKINKPVVSAELFADKDHLVELKPLKDEPTILEASWVPDETRKYRLHLVDDHERSCKQAPVFTITVTKNTAPRIEVAFPKRDAKVSPLQELALEAKVWDDVGVLKAGAVIDVAEAKKEVPLPLAKAEQGKKIDVKTMLNLESEGVEPQQLVSYYFWAEDKGPNGEMRRTMSDMFFAEVRAFEDIFRETEPPPSEEGEGKPTQTDQLVKLQKDIVNANWRLQRDQAGGKAMPQMKADVDTVMTSQAIAQEKLDEALEKVEDAKVKASLVAAKKQMQIAEKTLAQASEKLDVKALNEAMTPEQAALRFLHQAQNNEHRVTKANPKSSKGQGQQEQKQKEEISMLELKQKEQRYEEEKQAGEEKTAEQQENLTVLNRLKELARRQEALAEKMKELEQQLAQAKTEDQKEELANQLKRLQDEQDQLLRDLDDLKERMEKPENAANMAEAKQQLEETRDKVNEAAEKLRDEKLAQASSAASRAQKDLEKARDDFRQRTARRFTEELKSMRDQARELADAQKKLSEEMENQPGESKDAFDTTSSLKQRLSGAQASRKIEEQKDRASKLMEDMKRVSEQAEATEPLLHKQLYDSLRAAHTLGLEENLAEASAQSRYGDRNAAQDAERRAGKAVDQLKAGVERAAESVLGNESEALRMARNELDKLIDQAKGETTDGKDANAGSKKALADASKKGESDKSKPGDPKGSKGSAEAKGDKPGQQPGKDGKGQMAQAEGKGDKDSAAQGEGKEPGQKPGEGNGQTASAEKGQGQGQQPGDPKDGKGEMAGASSKGEGKGQAPGQGKGKGDKPGEGQDGEAGDGKSQTASAGGKGGQSKQPGEGKKGDGQQGGQRTAAEGGGGGGDWFFDEAKEAADESALTGAGFGQWTDRLRNLEEALGNPELRNQVATVLDRARQYRGDYERHSDKPAVEYLNTRIVAPLVELRDKVTEELARREGKNPLAPVDRDPVPEAYRELVQKYYEQLGAGK
jgi:hypothetical protein